MSEEGLKQTSKAVYVLEWFWWDTGILLWAVGALQGQSCSMFSAIDYPKLKKFELRSVVLLQTSSISWARNLQAGTTRSSAWRLKSQIPVFRFIDGNLTKEHLALQAMDVPSGLLCREVGTRCSLRSLPTQNIVWFYCFPKVYFLSPLLPFPFRRKVA